MTTLSRDTLVNYLNTLLPPMVPGDGSINGLQCEGAVTIKKIALAVDAAMETFEAAVAAKCQMLIVHHGILWKGTPPITGPFRRQIAYMMKHDLNLYASHLPLDIHPTFGNNTVLAKHLGLAQTTPFGELDGIAIGVKGQLPKAMTAHQLVNHLQTLAGSPAAAIDAGPRTIRTVGIVSGKGSFALMEASQLGLDALITGEPSYPDYHQAKEAGITLIYMGHYASETGGVHAIGQHLTRQFKVPTTFLDCPAWKKKVIVSPSGALIT